MRQWGPWSLDENNWTLDYGDTGWCVDLEKCTSSAAVLDFVAQFAGKQWATPKEIGHLVRALDELIQLQHNLCSDGINGSDGKELGDPISVIRENVAEQIWFEANRSKWTQKSDCGLEFMDVGAYLKAREEWANGRGSN